MKGIMWGALACASLVAVASSQAGTGAVRGGSGAQAKSAADAGGGVRRGGDAVVGLTLETAAFDLDVRQGRGLAKALRGTWESSSTAPVFLQLSDDGGHFSVPSPSRAPARGSFSLGATLPRDTAPGTYAGNLTVRACQDVLCTAPWPGTTRTIAYTVTVEGIGEWGTLQRNARHDGYVPISIKPGRMQPAWSWTAIGEDARLSAVVTDGATAYFAEYGSTASVRALRASDGGERWRRVFTSAYGGAPSLTPPTVSGDRVYAATTGHDDTLLYALRADNGLELYRSGFSTQWGRILAPVVHDGRAYVNAGYFSGTVFAFTAGTGAPVWNAQGGTYGMNTPAVDDDHVYAYNGDTLRVLSPATGALVKAIGPDTPGSADDYKGTPMLGGDDSVTVYSGAGRVPNGMQRQLLNYSVADGAVRWMSLSLYGNFPAVARGVVYATSNETGTLDALDEATGERLWSWTPPENDPVFIGNVVATDTVVFASTETRVYAVDLRRRGTAWSAATPGELALASDGTLYVSTPGQDYPSRPAKITAYR